MEENDPKEKDGNNEFTLGLTYKGLTEFPDYLFTNDAYRNLKIIHLGRNLICELPKSIIKLTALTSLYINHNKLQNLPEELGSLLHLEILNVTGNEIKSLPESLGKLLNLRKLEICNNKLSKLPLSIGLLSELRTLEAANNTITSIPIELSQCTNLVTLNLDNNRLTVLPRQLRQLENLYEFSAVGNNLFVLPQDIGSIDSLRTLYVDKNERLYTLPSTSRGKQVGFIGCGCVSLPAEVVDRFLYVRIQHTLTDKLPILLPPDIQQLCDMKCCVPSLLELAMRVTTDNIQIEGIRDSVPNDLFSLVTCPTARCENCKRTIYLSAFPIVYKEYMKSAYILGFCCSLLCVKKCYYFNNTSLPVVYPSSEDFCVALVLVQ